MNVTERVNLLHDEIENALNSSVEKAIKIGELLITEKSKLKHGDWTTWIERNLTFKPRMARNYIQIYENRNRLDEPISTREAVKQIASPKRQRVADLLIQPEIKKPQQKQWDKIQKLYTVYGKDEEVAICWKNEMKYQNRFEAIGHLLIMDPAGIDEVRKYLKRMLIKGEKRDNLLAEIDEIEMEIMEQVEILN